MTASPLAVRRVGAGHVVELPVVGLHCRVEPHALWAGHVRGLCTVRTACASGLRSRSEQGHATPRNVPGCSRLS
eukprot:7111147-Prymnesium_polylepis.1